MLSHNICHGSGDQMMTLKKKVYLVLHLLSLTIKVKDKEYVSKIYHIRHHFYRQYTNQTSQYLLSPQTPRQVTPQIVCPGIDFSHEFFQLILFPGLFTTLLVSN